MGIILIRDYSILSINNTMGYIYAIAAAITWGFVYAIDQKILDKISPSLLMLINSIFSILILLPLFFFQSDEIRTITSLDKPTLKIIAVSLVFTLIANLLIYMAIRYMGSSRAAIFEIAYPFFVVLFSVWMFHTQVNGYFILGAVLLFIGSAIIIVWG